MIRDEAGSAVNAIARLAGEALGPIVEDGQTFVRVGDRMVRLQAEDTMAPTLGVGTLEGFVDAIEYVRGELLEGPGLLIHVTGPTEVRLHSRGLSANRRLRELFVSASCSPPCSKTLFGRFEEADRFVIDLQALFADAGQRAEVLAFAGSVVEEDVRSTNDDGVTQKLTVRKGIAREDKALPNPVLLAPRRSFPEIEPVVSPFVFRAEEGPRFALFEADGGAWRVATIEAITTWLRGRLGSDLIKIIR